MWSYMKAKFTFFTDNGVRQKHYLVHLLNYLSVQ